MGMNKKIKFRKKQMILYYVLEYDSKSNGTTVDLR